MNTELIDQFIDYYWLSTGASKNTLAAYRSDLKIFNKWLAGKSFISVNSKHIQDYFSDRQKNNIGSSTQARILTSLHSFYQYLLANQLIKKDPTEQLSHPKLEKKLPVFLNIKEVEKLLEAPSGSSLIGQRDRAMLELSYSCGLRVSELINLSYHNINLKEEFIRIHGKGNKERVLPMGEIAIDYLLKYETNARPVLLKNGQSDSYFLSNRGSAMSRQNFFYIIKAYATQVGIDKPLSPHSLRHAFATHLLNGRADLRSGRVLLGKSSLSTTQIYTHSSLAELKKVYQEAHPRSQK